MPYREPNDCASKEDRCFSNICSICTNCSTRPLRAARRSRRLWKPSIPTATSRPIRWQAPRAQPTWCASAFPVRAANRSGAALPPSACSAASEASAHVPSASASYPTATERLLRSRAQRSSSTCAVKATCLQATCSSRLTCAPMRPRCRTNPYRSWDHPWRPQPLTRRRSPTSSMPSSSWTPPRAIASRTTAVSPSRPR